MAKVRTVLNQPGLDELLRSDDVMRELERRLERSEQAAKSTAPIATGTYRDSIHVERVVEGGVAQVRLVSDVDYAVYVEADTGNLARSLDAAGGV